MNSRSYNETKFEENILHKYNNKVAKKRLKLHDENEEKVHKILFGDSETDKLSSQFKTVCNKKDNATTSSGSNVTEVAESQYSKGLPTKVFLNIKIGTVNVRKDEFFFADENKFEVFKKLFRGKHSQNSLNGKKRMASVIPNNGLTNYCPTIKAKLHLMDIEQFYNKYFGKFEQETIEIIANLMNLILWSNYFHSIHINMASQMKTEAQRLEAINEANEICSKRKDDIIEKLREHFLDVVSKIMGNDFKLAMKMLFLNILSVLKVLGNPNFITGDLFKKLKVLLWTNLKFDDFPKMIILLKSRYFQSDCIELITFLENCRSIDSGLTNRMTLFFLSASSSHKHFKPVIETVISGLNENLKELIIQASDQFRFQSMLKYQAVSSSPSKQESSDQKPTIFIQSVFSPKDTNRSKLLKLQKYLRCT